MHGQCAKNFRQKQLSQLYPKSPDPWLNAGFKEPISKSQERVHLPPNTHSYTAVLQLVFHRCTLVWPQIVNVLNIPIPLSRTQLPNLHLDPPHKVPHAPVCTPVSALTVPTSIWFSLLCPLQCPHSRLSATNDHVRKGGRGRKNLLFSLLPTESSSLYFPENSSF